MRPEPQSAVPSLERSSSTAEPSDGTHPGQATGSGLAGRARPQARKRWLASRLTLVAFSLVLLGISIPLALVRQSRETAQPPPEPTPSLTPGPPRVPFAFALAEVRASATGAKGNRAAENVAAEVQTSLSGFYDQVFLDPLTWTVEGIPPGVWNVFTETLRDRAARDAEALTLGGVAAQVAALEVTRSSLDVRVLLDPQGRPQAAVAEVLFRATGSITSGEEIRIVNRASFLFRPSSGEWLIVGYPSADTTVKPAKGGASA